MVGIFRHEGNFYDFPGWHVHVQRLAQGDGQVASPICRHRTVVSLKGNQRRVIHLGGQVARILRQRGKAQEAVAAHRAGNRPHTVVTVPRNDAQTAAAHRSHQPRLIGAAVGVRVKEDNIALLRRIPFHAAVQAPRFSGKRPHPAGAVGCIRHRLAGNPGIVQAEGNKHGAPVAIGIAVPVAVTGIALPRAILGNGIVAFAFGIAKLALGNGDNILRPDAGQRHTGDTVLPNRLALHIRFRVREAAQGMGVLLLITDQHLFIARLCMDMDFTGQHIPGLIAGLPMGMTAFTCFLAAGVGFLRLIAAVGMHMILTLIGAGLNLIDLDTAFIMDVSGSLLQPAYQHPLLLIAFRRMDMGLPRCLFMTTDQTLFVALLRMLVLLMAAIGRLLSGFDRQDHPPIGGDEHHRAGQGAYHPLPDPIWMILHCLHPVVVPHTQSPSFISQCRPVRRSDMKLNFPAFFRPVQPESTSPRRLIGQFDIASVREYPHLISLQSRKI